MHSWINDKVNYFKGVTVKRIAKMVQMNPPVV